jgi:hypothetical protein
MRGRLAGLFALVMAAAPLAAQEPAPPSEQHLAAVTKRGRMLAAYDAAAWHGTDAVMAIGPNHARLGIFLARENGGRWTVYFGRLSAARDTFYTAYEARQGARPAEFTARALEPAAADTGLLLRAARALRTATEAFGNGARRPYNMAVLPNSSGWWVYLYPAAQVQGVWPHGGDVRYHVSADGRAIVEERRMHRSILELRMDANATAGIHTAVLREEPEDTDVLYVLQRTPRIPEYVRSRNFVFVIAPDGAIVSMSAQVFESLGATPRHRP